MSGISLFIKLRAEGTRLYELVLTRVLNGTSVELSNGVIYSQHLSGSDGLQIHCTFLLLHVLSDNLTPPQYSNLNLQALCPALPAAWSTSCGYHHLLPLSYQTCQLQVGL